MPSTIDETTCHITAEVCQVAGKPRKNEKRYCALLEMLRDTVYASTMSGELIHVNQSALDLFGYTREEMTGMNISNIYVDSEDMRRLQQEIEQNGSVKDYEVKLRRSNGIEMECQIISTLRLSNDNSILGYQGVIYPIAKVEKTEEERKQKTQMLMNAIRSTIEAMAATTELRDPYTAGHQRRVADLAVAIGKEMRLSKDWIEGIRMAAIVHDIDKIYVPAEILSKPGRLNEIEFALIKMHAKCGYDILKTIESPWPIAKIVLQHHMRMDGSGYPDRETAGKLMPQARILAVADVVEAVSSHRPYRIGLGIDKALEEITQHRGTLYDADAVDACRSLFIKKAYQLQ